MNASAPGLVSAATVRAHIELLHAQAARALNGAERPGVLQLEHRPYGRRRRHTRFAIGQIDRMVEAAIADASAGKNVYVEARTVSETLRGRARGAADATRGVFAFVVDADADKGKPATLPVEPSLIVESSPGNLHYWLFLDRALTADEAKPIGEAIRAGIGGDADTGVITQPIRVAGTPNYPSPNKIERGRTTVEPTRILKSDGPIYTADAARARRFRRSRRPSARNRRRPSRTGVIATRSRRSRPSAARIGPSSSSSPSKAAVAAGMGPDDVEEVFRRHPNGCASKFLSPMIAYEGDRPRLGQGSG